MRMTEFDEIVKFHTNSNSIVPHYFIQNSPQLSVVVHVRVCERAGKTGRENTFL